MYANFYGSSWLIFVLPAMIFAGYAQFKVKTTFSQYSKIPSESGMTGQQVARIILDRNGLSDVPIEAVRGNLTDHYDPSKRVIRLSESVYGRSSIASVSVAAHEVGHAMQHAEGYFPLTLRSSIAPIANFGSRLVWIFIILGIIISRFFIDIGIALFMGVVLFQIVTLPVEFNASKRAIVQLEEGLIPSQSIKPAKKVLNAAALTYVAATIVALAELLRLIAIRDRR